MEVKHIYTRNSLNNPQNIQLVGEVCYDDKPNIIENYWFEFDKEYEKYISLSGTPWLACLLPLASVLKEPLRINAPVDSKLYANIGKLMHIWKEWYPELAIIPVEANVENTRMDNLSKDTACFFSGGIDSFFSVLHNETNRDPNIPTRINDLISVGGFDIPLSNISAFYDLCTRYRNIASKLGKRHIAVVTNLKETKYLKANFAQLSHGCALAAIGLFLEKKYSNILIAATHDKNHLEPWGSHPHTDILLSTQKTEIVHDGNDFNRVQKSDFLSSSDLALQNLLVCSRSKSDKNCCKCNKCYRAMMTFEILGTLDKCSTFKKDSFCVRKIKNIYTPDENHRILLREVLSLAKLKKRNDIAIAIEASIRSSEKINKYIRIINKIRAFEIFKTLKIKRFILRFLNIIEYYIRKNIMT